MYFVYMLKCSDNTIYTGITIDLKKRLEMHNSGMASKYTRSRLPVSYIYVEKSGSRSQAQAREFQIRKLSREKKIDLAKKSSTYLSELDL